MDRVIESAIASAPRLSLARMQSSRRPYTAKWQTIVLAVDLLAFFASFYVAVGLVNHNWTIRNYVSFLTVSAWLSIGMWILIFAKVGMYRASLASSSRDEIYYTVAALSLGIVPQLVLFTLDPALSTSRLLLFVAVGCATLGVGGGRAVVHLSIRIAENSSFKRVLVVTADSEAQPDVGDHNVLKQWRSFIYRCDLAAACGPSPQAIWERISWFRAAARENCDMIVIQALLPSSAAAHVADLAWRQGVDVRFAPPELRQSPFDLLTDRRGRQTLLAPVPLGILRPPAQFCKSVFDRTCALVALCLLSPLFVLIAAAIQLESGRPTLFRQARVGRGGRSFDVFKFRSMRQNAGSEWATMRDSRITRVGAVLRKFSLDELPQLFNVIKGEMSLVGPRPEMREYADDFRVRLPRYDERHLVKPGITGWTQINMRRHLTPADAEEVLENDLFYIQNWSFLLDLSILVKTATEILFHRGV